MYDDVTHTYTHTQVLHHVRTRPAEPLHIKYVMQIVGRALRLFNETLKTSVCDITVPTCEDGKLVILGDTHGQLSDFLWVLKQNGEPSPSTAYLLNGVCVCVCVCVCVLIHTHYTHTQHAHTQHAHTDTNTHTLTHTNTHTHTHTLTHTHTHTHTLGDIADRGEHACEILIIVLLYKLLYPDRVTINRGNHENIEMNRRSCENGGGFFDEVRSRRSLLTL